MVSETPKLQLIAEVMVPSETKIIRKRQLQKSIVNACAVASVKCLYDYNAYKNTIYLVTKRFVKFAL